MKPSWLLGSCTDSRSQSGETGSPSSRSRSPWRKNSAVIIDDHFLCSAQGLAGCPMSAALMDIESTSWRSFSSSHLTEAAFTCAVTHTSQYVAGIAPGQGLRYVRPP